MKKQKLMLGDNITSLKKLPDNSIDSVVTDPPYGLSFMGKKWDYDVPSVDFWKEVYRVLKPGGHVLSFGGTRTYHRLAVAIEDAGFEIRDQIQWLYGSGFPKSYNVGKGIENFNKTGSASWNGTGDSSNGVIGYTKIQYNQGNRNQDYSNKHQTKIEITNEWKGWGSGLKPANEPICLARKPLSEKSIVENVLKWRTGGLNIDGCRIGYKDDTDLKTIKDKANKDIKKFIERDCISVNWGKSNTGYNFDELPNFGNDNGRFPANIILDEIAADILDKQSGFSKSIKLPLKSFDTKDTFKKTNKTIRMNNYDDNGGASRFFYKAKVSKAERNMGLDDFEEKKKWLKGGGGSGISDRENVVSKNIHPTIKPVSLMTYLCRLITPPNGIVLDPFMGSGSTGISALLDGFRFVGMEMDPEYFKIAEARINSYEDYKKFLKK